MKLPGLSLTGLARLFLVLVASIQPTMRAEEPAPDFHNAEQFKAELKKIQERDKGDPRKLTEDLNALNKAAAKALGMEAEYDEQQRLLAKYGPLGPHIALSEGFRDGINLPPKAPDQIIDTDSWRVSVKSDGDALKISAYLDRKRYAGVRPKEVLIVLRGKDEEAGQEMRSVHAPDSTKSFRVPVKYEVSDDGVYTMNVVVPAADRAKDVVQIYADIETNWATAAFIRLEGY